ncbi:MAG: hypothetical protein J07HQW2_01952 [Haloquadratum walsbyi J07HQW2]|uniref:Uncharacterized protein n=1 Tax=Haloquadratum walsbyi J07HQW2 TaxID=1238425 RepID=U1NEP5_9EURY|nr:MAG: hypothetical protein J07HQW2_01952 [Haloquadratum walsbyi J07HQW2]
MTASGAAPEGEADTPPPPLIQTQWITEQVDKYRIGMVWLVFLAESPITRAVRHHALHCPTERG